MCVKSFVKSHAHNIGVALLSIWEFPTKLAWEISHSWNFPCGISDIPSSVIHLYAYFCAEDILRALTVLPHLLPDPRSKVNCSKFILFSHVSYMFCIDDMHLSNQQTSPTL